MNTVSDGVWQWLGGCEAAGDLFFGFARAAPGDTLLLPLSCGSDTELKRFIDGSSERRSVFSLTRIAPAGDAPGDETNLAALSEAEALARWIRARRAAGALPELPPGCRAFDVYPLDVGGGVFRADGESRARYTFSFCVEYVKDREA
ncbi:MAG: hypothetical protein IJH78_03095 [Clostridia bacterium]|nr:hypothetical protein [Clostridia bacterium]